MKNTDAPVNAKSYVFEMLRALIAALVVTLVLVLASALLIKLLNIPTAYIGVLNQVNKGVSVLTAALLCLRLPKAGYLRGIILGIAYILLSYLVFSLFSGEFSAGISLLNDVALGAVTGMVSGILAVNMRK